MLTLNTYSRPFPLLTLPPTFQDKKKHREEFAEWSDSQFRIFLCNHPRTWPLLIFPRSKLPRKNSQSGPAAHFGSYSAASPTVFPYSYLGLNTLRKILTAIPLSISDAFYFTQTILDPFFPALSEWFANLPHILQVYLRYIFYII